MPEIELNNGEEFEEEQIARLAGEILALGHPLRFRVRGGSMRPFLQDGDLLEIQPVQGRNIRLGDILLYQDAGRRLLVHRVVRVQRKDRQRGRSSVSYKIQGDALLHPDGQVAPEAILGRVISVERAGQTRSLNTWYQKVICAGYVFGLSGLKFVIRKTRLRKKRE